MKLYTYHPAPNPQRLHLFMQYKGIELETREVDMMAKEQLTDEYRAIVPTGTTPALVLDDGTVLTEVIGICRYLEDLYPQKPLLGTSPLERALVLSWDHSLFNTVFIPIAEVFRNGNPNFENRALPGPLDLPQIPALIDRGHARLDWIWPELDAELADKPWLTGENFTLADIDLYACVGFSGWIKSPPPDSCANLHAYLDRVGEQLEN